MNIYSAIVAAIAIWAVVRITQHWLATRQDSSPAGEVERQQEQIQQLESRVRTLERLLTDDRESLARRIDDLK